MHNDLELTNGRGLQHYNPEKGLKRIAVAEAAEKHFARAKDTEKLYQAIEAKLKAQRDFVMWWEGFVNAGRPKKNSSSAARISPGKDGMPDSFTISRWRARTRDEEAFNEALADAQERCRRIVEQEKGKSNSELVQQSISEEHYTPAKYVDAARAVLGDIDLDPASCAEANIIVKAQRFMTREDDGLSVEWNGRVWLNPPYCRQAGDFIQKLVDEYAAQRISAAVVLVSAHCTDTAWFQPLWDGILCFTDHRINFYGEGERSGSTHGSVFAYFGKKPALFAQQFDQFGAVVGRFGK